MSKTVLLVEDNSSHAELIGDELESALAAWTIEVAPTVGDAQRQRAARSYDLFVLDFRLPDGDGLELLREIRRTDSETPVLFLTTANSAKLAVDAIKLGADDYLVKEEGYLTELPQMLARILERRQMTRERREPKDRIAACRVIRRADLASGRADHTKHLSRDPDA